MSHSRRIVAVVGVLALTVLLFAQEAGAQVSSNPYRAVYGWEKLPASRGKLGVIAGIYMDPDGKHLWMLSRCEGDGNACLNSKVDPILKFDLDGNLVKSFGAGPVQLAARLLRRSRRQPVGHRRRSGGRSPRRRRTQGRQGPSGLQVQPRRQDPDDARRCRRAGRRPDAFQRPVPCHGGPERGDLGDRRSSRWQQPPRQVHARTASSSCRWVAA